MDGRAMHFSIDINRISVTAMTTPLRHRKCSYVSRAGFRSRPFVFLCVYALATKPDRELGATFIRLIAGKNIRSLAR